MCAQDLSAGGEGQGWSCHVTWSRRVRAHLVEAVHVKHNECLHVFEFHLCAGLSRDTTKLLVTR